MADNPLKCPACGSTAVTRAEKNISRTAVIMIALGIVIIIFKGISYISLAGAALFILGAYMLFRPEGSVMCETCGAVWKINKEEKN